MEKEKTIRIRKNDMTAVVRLLALAIAGDEGGVNELIEWAYGGNREIKKNEDIINKYLATDIRALSSYKKDFIRRFIESKQPFPTEAAKAIILHMPYEEFLKTPYWKAISDFVKERDFNRCTRCGNQKRLQVHHLTYQNHGDELHHLRDLVTLCRTCHNKIHNERRTHKDTQDDRKLGMG